MKQQFRKALALVSVCVLLIGIMMTSAFTVTAEDTETTTVTYDIEKKAADGSNAYVAVSDASAFHQSDVGHLRDSGTNAITYRAWRFSSATPVAGWVVYDAGTLVKQFEASAYMVSNQDPAKTMTFSVSNDMEHWIDVAATGEKNSTGTNNTYWVQCLYTGEAATPFRYIRVNFAAVASYTPGLHYVKMASYVPTKAESFTSKVLAPDAVVEGEGGSFVAVYGSYYGFTDGNKNTDGERYAGTVTVRSAYPITDYNFATLLSSVGWGGTIAFQASKDGADWEGLGAYTVATDGSTTTGSWKQSYNDNYGTLNAADGYYYLRAVMQPNADDLPLPRYPAIAYVEYNSAIPTNGELTAKTYAVTQLATEGKADSTGVLSAPNGTSLFNEYYVFEAADQASSDTTSLAGTVTFTSQYPITDFHVSLTRWSSLEATIEVSKDGATWDAVELVEVSDSTATIKWSIYLAEYYGHLLETDGYYHIRVSLPANNSVGVPALKCVEYDLVLPKEYANTVTGEEATAESAEGTELYHLTFQGGYGGKYTAFNYTGTGNSAAGALIFESKTPITDWHLHMMKSTLGGNFAHTIEFSTDGVVWKTVSLLEAEGEVYSNKNWAGQFTDYYTRFTEADGYRFVRVTLPENQYGVEVPSFGYMEYNAVEMAYPGECVNRIEILTSLVDNKQAIRFWHSLELSEGATESATDDILTVYGRDYTVNTIGVLFAYQDTLNGAELTVDNAAAKGSIASYRSRHVSGDAVTYSYTARIINVKQQNRDRDILCRGYLVCTDVLTGETVTLYSNSLHASVVDVYNTVTNKDAAFGENAAAMETWMTGEVA